MPMNPFLLGPRERMSDWKQLREGLKGLSEADQVRAVAHYWGKAPLVRFAYDAEDAKSWPTMWEMINENTWCRNSVAIGMEQTLRLSGWDPKRLKLVFVKDHDLSDMMMVCQIDDGTWLNYEHDTVSPIPETRREIMVCWQWSGRAYVEVPCR